MPLRDETGFDELLTLCRKWTEILSWSLSKFCRQSGKSTKSSNTLTAIVSKSWMLFFMLLITSRKIINKTEKEKLGLETGSSLQ